MTKDVQKRLAKLLVELEGRAKRVHADLSEPLSADFSDQATQTEDDEAQEAEDTVLALAIGMVKAALVRIDSGEYGYCTRCGGEIQKARLDAIPEAALCIDCAAKREAR